MFNNCRLLVSQLLIDRACSFSFGNASSVTAERCVYVTLIDNILIEGTVNLIFTTMFRFLIWEFHACDISFF